MSLQQADRRQFGGPATKPMTASHPYPGLTGYESILAATSDYRPPHASIPYRVAGVLSRDPVASKPAEQTASEAETKTAQ